MNPDTETLPGLFASPSAYRGAFEAGLARMLDESTLGAFILVLANASFEPGLQRRFQSALHAGFDDWCLRFDRDDAAARKAAADDRTVFTGLRSYGIDRLGLTRWRKVGDWWLQYNPLRAFRPPRSSQASVESLRRPFDPAGFHFDKPFLKPEIFWEGAWSGQFMRLLLNKFPFAAGHALLVPEPTAGRPQWLDAHWHHLIWDLARHAGQTLPGIGYGYNAIGAFASVNHLHFQQFVAPERQYPIELPRWRHNGGTVDYPLPVCRFDDANSAWQVLDRMQQHERCFNLLYRPGRLYIIERAIQGAYRHSSWSAGFAWSEVAGTITVSDESAFVDLDEPQLLAEFASARAPALR